jgi:hypothetical protein
MRLLIGPRRDDDVPRTELSGGRSKEEAPPVDRSEGGDLDTLADGCSDARRVPGEMGDDRVSRQESVRIVAAIGPAGKLDRPVRRDETEAVPAPAPGLPDHAAVQDDVIDTGVGQLVAQGESGLSGSDHRDIDVVAHLRLPTVGASWMTPASSAAPSGS